MKKVSARLWISLILIGLTGQFAWTIENMYLNVFLYNTISTDPNYIAAMVSASAIAATLTTLLMGCLSDRLGRRRGLISAGYVIWGLSTAAFGLITTENATKLFPAAPAAAAAAMTVIVLDCVMTFFGSTANDAAFNAYITDQIPNEKRGRVESALAILPLLSMLVVFGLFDGMTQRGEWLAFFSIFGTLVTAVGVASFFLLPKEKAVPRRDPFLAQLVYGFRPSVMKRHAALYLSLLCMCVFSIAVQVFFPYLIIYMQHSLKLDAYALVLGAVLIVSSVSTLVLGGKIDKLGKLRFAAAAACVMFIGLISMYFVRSMAWVIISGMIMMSGYMLLSSALTAQMRELTPPKHAGHFQGVRMVFTVMLPMIAGPFIGAWVIRSGGETYVDLGQVKTVPTPGIFVAAAAILVLVAIPMRLLSRKLRPAPAGPLYTSWGERLDKACPLNGYPRPQFVRDSYLNLNGPWDYAITQSDEAPAAYDGTILVPFSPESVLSGVNRMVTARDTLWYRRKIVMPQGFVKAHTILHFGAVDQEAAVWLNGRKVASHMGGYTAFSADVTEALLPGENELIVRVHDDTDASWHTRGKQKTKRGGIWYTPQSGIWQTVWMESIPEDGIDRLDVKPCFDEAKVEIAVISSQNACGTLVLNGQDYPFTANEVLSIPLPGFRAWSPDDPYLYEFTVTLGDDRVSSYFAMRKTEVRPDKNGVNRLFLNNEVCFHNGLLDQGYWPDGLYTPPSDEAMIFDIQTAKDLGYNMLRKHIKIEPMRWYYHCDRIGMLVWQDMVSGGGEYKFWTITTPLVTGRHQQDNRYRAFARSAEEGRREYMNELSETVRQLKDVPSIVLWVPFNEGWGQFDAAIACERIMELDPTRPIDHASGWHDQQIGLIKSLHVYFKPYRFQPDRLGRAVVLSEFGGYNLRADGHCFSAIDFGYKKLPSPEALWQAYQSLYEQQILPAIPKGLAATVYTQLTDVEDELNGILTYDRKVLKLPKEHLQQLNQKLK